MSKIRDSPRKRIFGWEINDTLGGSRVVEVEGNS